MTDLPSSTGSIGLPDIPDDDKDFSPDLARKIISTYQQIIYDLTDGITGTMQKDEMERLRAAAEAEPMPSAYRVTWAEGGFDISQFYADQETAERVKKNVLAYKNNVSDPVVVTPLYAAPQPSTAANSDDLVAALQRMAGHDPRGPGLTWDDNKLLIQSAAQAAKDALAELPRGGAAAYASPELVEAASKLIEEISTRGTHERWKRLANALPSTHGGPELEVAGDETSAGIRPAMPSTQEKSHG